MARYQVILAYDGTHYAGFQRQVRARTVQGVVEVALRQLGWQERVILSAGRTDTGVHASGQVIAFDLDWAHSESELLQALNANLPEDVAVKSVAQAASDFHPRFSAVARRYRYRIVCADVRDPLRERYAWRIWPAVDLDRLRAAAAVVIGAHDFAAYGSPPHPGGRTGRTVFSAGWQPRGEELIFEITANAFLYHMVRRTVFLQVQVGRSRLEPGDLIDPVADRIRQLPGLAPAHGLELAEVYYKEAVNRVSNGQEIWNQNPMPEPQIE